MNNRKTTSQTTSAITVFTFIILSLYLSTHRTFPINQLATIAPTPFSALQLPLQRNLKPFRVILAPCTFHLTSRKQEISTQCLFKMSDISPHFLDRDPLFHVDNWIQNCTSGDSRIIRARVQSVFLAGFSAFFLT